MKRLIIIAATLLAFLSPAIAADSTVPAMGAASAVSGTDGFYCIQGAGTTEHECTAAQLQAFMLTATNNITKSGALTPASQMLLNVTGTLTGSPTSIINAYQNNMLVSTDSMDTSGSTDRGQAGVLYISQGVGGTSEIGGRVALNSTLNINGLTGNAAASINPNYVAAGFYGIVNANDGGTSGTASGQIYGFNPNVQLGAAATFWSSLIGGEIDIAAKTGSSVHHKVGLQIIQTSVDAVAGDRTDCGLCIENESAVGTTPGWSNGIQFGSYNGFNAVATTGTLIGTGAHAGAGGNIGTVVNGVDFRQYTFTGCAFESTGFCIDNSGNATVASCSGCTPGGSTPSDLLSGTWGQLTHGLSVAAGSVSVVANNLYCVFGGVASSTTIKILGSKVTTGSSGSMQFGLYSVSGGTLTLVDSTVATVSTTSIANVQSPLLNTTDLLSANVLYALCTDFSATPQLATYTVSGGSGALARVGATSSGNAIAGSVAIGKSISQTFGTMPGTVTLSAMSDIVTNVLPQVGFQVN